MPFKSENQRRYLWANEPNVARRWSEKYGSRPVAHPNIAGGFKSEEERQKAQLPSFAKGRQKPKGNPHLDARKKAAADRLAKMKAASAKGK